ncbi:hypothetical protein [uncultured Clostridium sp.]|uniref:hypothetical protein n=1 Tax=uncultured Clostridium sp. TaxID=59620 RepID=UPI0026333450|nr:hypothetical protein [uncultured Clostridium sp.]
MKNKKVKIENIENLFEEKSDFTEAICKTWIWNSYTDEEIELIEFRSSKFVELAILKIDIDILIFSKVCDEKTSFIRLYEFDIEKINNSFK